MSCTRSSCRKGFLVFINILLMIAAIAVGVTGFLFAADFSSIFPQVLDIYLNGTNVEIWGYIFLATGLFVAFLAVFGLCCVCCSSRCMFIGYSWMNTLTLLFNASLAAYLIATKDSDSISEETDAAIWSAIEEDYVANSSLWNSFVDGCPTDSPQAHEEQCQQAVISEIRSRWALVGFLLLGLVALQIICCIVACCFRPAKTQQQLAKEKSNEEKKKEKKEKQKAERKQKREENRQKDAERRSEKLKKLEVDGKPIPSPPSSTIIDIEMQ